MSDTCMDMLRSAAQQVEIKQFLFGSASAIRPGAYRTTHSTPTLNRYECDSGAIEIHRTAVAVAADQVLAYCEQHARHVISYCMSSMEPSFDLDDGSRIVISGGALRLVTCALARHQDAVWLAVRDGDGDGMRRA